MTFPPLPAAGVAAPPASESKPLATLLLLLPIERTYQQDAHISQEGSLITAIIA